MLISAVQQSDCYIIYIFNILFHYGLSQDTEYSFLWAEEPEIRLPTSAGSLKKQESSKKNPSISALLTMPKPLTVWITINCGKF